MDNKLGREGHRKRMRTNYIANGISTLEDHNVLELFLSLVIPQKDVKPLAYELINQYGNLENVMNADVEDLMQVKGIGESSAIALSLVKDINGRISLNKNKSVTRLSDSNASQMYAKNILNNEDNEKLIMITLDNSLSIIKTHTINSGIVNSLRAEPKKILEYVIKDNASSVVVAHNHPHGNAIPSASDINFTLDLIQLLRKLNVRVNDHVVVGEKETLSMNNDARYMIYFDK